jgi:hypothetical protein
VRASAAAAAAAAASPAAASPAAASPATNPPPPLRSPPHPRYISSNPTASSWTNAFDDLDADASSSLNKADLASQFQLSAELAAESTDASALSFAPPPAPRAFGADASFLATLEAAKPPPPAPPAEGEEPPPAPPKEVTAAPNSSLALSWVHGYSGALCRRTLLGGISGSLVYAAATNVVVYHKADEEAKRPEPTQQLMQDSPAPISALCACPSGALVAAGNRAGTVYLLSSADASVSGTICAPLPPGSAVSKLAFNADRSLLALAGGDADATLCVFEVATHRLLFAAKTGKAPVLGLAFSAGEESTIAVATAGTGGGKPATFWVRDKADRSSWLPKRGVFGSTAPSPCTCVSSLGPAAAESFVAGTAGGDLLIWEGRNLKLVLPKVANGAVSDLHYNAKCGVLAVGSEDGIVQT